MADTDDVPEQMISPNELDNLVDELSKTMTDDQKRMFNRIVSLAYREISQANTKCYELRLLLESVEINTVNMMSIQPQGSC